MFVEKDKQTINVSANSASHPVFVLHYRELNRDNHFTISKTTRLALPMLPVTTALSDSHPAFMFPP